MSVFGNGCEARSAQVVEGVAANDNAAAQAAADALRKAVQLEEGQHPKPRRYPAPRRRRGQLGAPRRVRQTAAPQQPVAMIDVTTHLEQLAAKNSEQLNWRTSIVDLLKLLDMDRRAAARRELADELGAPAGLQSGSAEMNTWLHRTVLRKIADNGNIACRKETARLSTVPRKWR